MNLVPSRNTSRKNITVIQGEVEISDDPNVVLSTILGSCVSVCIWDPKARIGGMNHFLLAQGSGQADVKYGAFAMEKLINQLLKAGAQRKALQSKLFGGASVSGFGGTIGRKNAQFARNFVADEGIVCIAESLEGDQPRRVRFSPTTGQVQMLFVQPAEVAPETSAPKMVGSDVTLF